MDDLFAQSDIVSLHCPQTLENTGFINTVRLSQMKSTALLINTGRGPLINEPALAEALLKEQIAGAAVDVLSEEPPSKDNPLLNAKNILITPHIAWGTRAARQRLMEIAIKNLKQFLRGQPINVVHI